MISFGMLIGPLSLAAGILLLLIGLATFLWLSGKIEGYDSINEMLFRDNPALGIRYTLTQWIEPIWKMLLSNKGILPILWELFPGHPNLLECYFNEPKKLTDYVKKPLLSREGANLTI